MLKERAQTFQTLSQSLDIACILGAFVGATSLRVYHNEIPLLGWVPQMEPTRPIGLSAEYLLFLLLTLLLWIVAMRYAGVYRPHRVEQLSSIVRAYLNALVLCGLGAGFIAFALKFSTISRLFTLYFFSLAFLLLVGKQLSVISFLRYLRRKGYNARNVMIVGHEEQAAHFARKVEEEQETGYRVVRVIADKELKLRRDLHPLEFLQQLGSDEIDEVFFVPAGGGLSDLQQLLAFFLLKQGKRVFVVPSLIESRFFRQGITDFAGIPILSLGGTGLDDLQALGKRVLDVLGAVILAVLLSPMFVVVALLVKLASSGPALFLQERLGRDGRRFFLYKFRTMRTDAEDILRSNHDLYEKYIANNYKLPEEDDLRITPIGRFLRKTSLDELPQLFNVLKGNMSLVGPRPIVPQEIEKYGDYDRLFLSVKPGLTGYWQVNGRSKVDYPLRAELDLEYIRDQSLKMDIDILLKTIPAVIKQKGAY